jgi:hypothetical protein
MITCDICGKSATYGIALPHKQIHALTLHGWTPAGFASISMVKTSGRDANEYWRDIVGRYGATDEWGLCPSCQQEAQNFAKSLMGMR